MDTVDGAPGSRLALPFVYTAHASDDINVRAHNGSLGNSTGLERLDCDLCSRLRCDQIRGTGVGL